MGRLCLLKTLESAGRERFWLGDHGLNLGYSGDVRING